MPPALPAWLLLQACANGRPGQRFSALLPHNAFAGSLATKPRADLLASADVSSSIEAEGLWNDDLGVHRSYRVALLTVTVREAAPLTGRSSGSCGCKAGRTRPLCARSSAPCSGRPAERR